MFAIKYKTWKTVCEMYFKQGKGLNNKYLQWFPFSELSLLEKETLKGEAFFTKYIESGAICMFPMHWLRTENYLQKGDGSFRESCLLSPTLYLLLQAVGFEISKQYMIRRQEGISVYYAGNIYKERCYYKKEYDEFFKEINWNKGKYKHFIKTDIRDFYNNINLDKLISRIDDVANSKGVQIQQHVLLLYKELLAYCGAGRFPLVENSVASSFLATTIYLDDVDEKLFKFIDRKVPWISEFKMIRYVDDLYILYNLVNESISECEITNCIIREYSSRLKEDGLALNMKKIKYGLCENISDELKKSLYDESYWGKKCIIPEIASDSLMAFLQQIDDALECGDISNEEYTEIVDKAFSVGNVEYSPTEVFNYFAYDKESEKLGEKEIALLQSIVCKNINFIAHDARRIVALILKSKDGQLIRTILNELFSRHSKGIWNSYDTVIAITYLIQRGFKHKDLIDIIQRRCPLLYKYYICFCVPSMLVKLLHKDTDSFLGEAFFMKDKKVFFLHTMFIFERSKRNMLTAFAYYKTFFDRLTAHMDFLDMPTGKTEPNYDGFYKLKVLRVFYAKVRGAEAVLNKAHKLRIANPLIHAGAELIDNENRNSDILDSILSLKRIARKKAKRSEQDI